MDQALASRGMGRRGPVHIGELIGLELRRLAMSQTALARSLDVEQSSVSRWVSGVSRPDAQLLPRIAEFLSISHAEAMRLAYGLDDVQTSALEAGSRLDQIDAKYEALFRDVQRRLVALEAQIDRQAARVGEFADSVAAIMREVEEARNRRQPKGVTMADRPVRSSPKRA